MPQINGYLAGLRKSQKFVIENRDVLERSHEAVMVKIMENENAAAALAITKSPHFAAAGGNVPDLEKAGAARRKK